MVDPVSMYAIIFSAHTYPDELICVARDESAARYEVYRLAYWMNAAKKSLPDKSSQMSPEETRSILQIRCEAVARMIIPYNSVALRHVLELQIDGHFYYYFIPEAESLQ